MIYTFIADISRLNTEAALKYQNRTDINDICIVEKKIKKIPEGKIPKSDISEDIISHIISANNADLRRERCASYMLLSAIMKEMFGGMPPIIRSANGKPRFDNDFGIYFSISHTADAVAVSVSCDSLVGVDIEGEIDPARALRLEQRFFSELSFCESKTDVTYVFSIFDENGKMEFYPFLLSNDGSLESKSPTKATLTDTSSSECFSARWTLYEATLKCDGGGFTSLPCLGMLLIDTHADIKTVNIKGKTYYISTASSK